jgi:acetoin utilization deacetylase AcuC-like enzyme/GNAT superfamily N-acetyltransferase
MIRIHRVHSSTLPVERERIEQVKEIFRENFSAVADYAEKIPDMLEHPFKYGYLTILLVSESGFANVTGFSLFLLFPEINSGLLDFIAIRRTIRSGGIGSALFEATEEYLHAAGARGMYMEVPPDDSQLIKTPEIREENRKRLRFYELYGIRPIINTEYETPLGPSPAPYLLFDDLGRGQPLRRAECRVAVQLILKRKYSHLVSPEYIERVVESITDDPVQMRPPRYVKQEPPARVVGCDKLEKPFALVCGEKHILHEVKDRGYVERPARVGALKSSLEPTGLFDLVPLKQFSQDCVRAVHDGEFLRYIKVVCEKLNSRRPVYPYVFPIRRPDRPPRDLAVCAGYYCIDTFTPLDANAYQAACQAVDVAMTAAEQVIQGRKVAYALCRPPGHHAERKSFGGFCYFNNAAICSNFFSKTGKVANLDIDYHHGNGTQDIFYQRDDVLTLSIHGHPNHSYPYFSGFADETGEGPGKGFNRNYPLPENTDEKGYLEALEKAITRIEQFKPVFLVISIGFDTMRGDPTGSFVLTADALRKIGMALGRLNLPTLVVQEGGYNLRNLKRGSVAFFGGMAQAQFDIRALQTPNGTKKENKIKTPETQQEKKNDNKTIS